MKDKDKNKENNKKETAEKEEKIINLTEKEFKELKEKAQKADTYYEQLIRLKADFENALKHFEKQKSEYIKLANFSLIKDLLTILDDFERIIEFAQKKEKEFKDLKEAINMVYKNLLQRLKSEGLKETPTDFFDPFYHEAVSTTENKDLEDNKIVEVLQKGYLLNEKVLRTAKVIVNKVSVEKEGGE